VAEPSEPSEPSERGAPPGAGDPGGPDDEREPDPTPTTAFTDPTPGWIRFERVLRAVTISVLVAIVVAAAVGLLGVRSHTVSSSAGGYELAVHYGRIVRPGLPTPFEVTVRADQGTLPPEVALRITSAYLDVLDENGMDPQPTDTYRDGDDTTWTFAVPDGEAELVVDLDVRIEPTEQLRRPGAHVALLVDDRVVDEVAVRSWILP
jgi:hypothetical protein